MDEDEYQHYLEYSDFGPTETIEWLGDGEVFIFEDDEYEQTPR
jgi:hypothetical protein